jgi:asparagine synthase (glutamine-hydrolysing)
VDVAGGDQPILSGDGKIGIAFNGAIYGFRELKDQLAGYPFKTETDTEVILALYDRYGDEFLSYLPGMFSFAIWDERRQLLTCARDRFGEKPLYYAFAPQGEFLVASEIKAILASGLIDPILNLEGVSHYLSRLHVHPAHTIYTNIHVLPPAHVLRFENGRLRIERYWEPPQATVTMPEREAVERFRELFDRAVRKQLVADVPVGILLSGGVDSSTVAAVASQHKPGVSTFSFGFKAGVESELPYARGIANRYHTSHFELCDEDLDVAGLLVRMQAIYDEPLGDSSNIPTFLVCEMARRHVTVALGGDGADELLGGYVFWGRNFLEPAPAPESQTAKGASRAMNRLARWLHRTTPAPHGSPLARRYAQNFRNYFPREEQQRMGLCAPAEHLIDYARYSRNNVSDMLRFDMEMYLPGDILVKTDRAAMASSLELRAPFLDVDVASFCLTLPETLKVDRNREKLILRYAYEDAWTPEIRTRDKQGFGSPMPIWLQLPSVHALKHDVLGNRSSRIYSVLDFGAVQRYIDENNQQTWSLLVLALWMERHACTIPPN